MNPVKQKILIVDEDKAIQRKYRELLERHNFEVFQTGDVASAIHMAQQSHPQLILINLGLPGGGGHLGIQRMKSLIPLREIPIIAFSNEDPSQAMKDALQKGASDFISKKADEEFLVQTIKSHIERSN